MDFIVESILQYDLNEQIKNLERENKKYMEQNKKYAEQNSALKYKLDGVTLAKDEIYQKYQTLIICKSRKF